MVEREGGLNDFLPEGEKALRSRKVERERKERSVGAERRVGGSEESWAGTQPAHGLLQHQRFAVTFFQGYLDRTGEAQRLVRFGIVAIAGVGHAVVTGGQEGGPEGEDRGRRVVGDCGGGDG